MATIADIIEALEILAEYGDAPVDGTILVGEPGLRVDPDDGLRLEALGWFVEQDTRRWARVEDDYL